MCLLLAGLAAGCTRVPDPGPALPEPTAALRPPELRGAVPADARTTDYVLDARLDTASRQVTGKAQVTWRNRTGTSVDVLPFHLYLNAFRAEDTVWMEGGRGRHRGNDQGEEGSWGYLDVHAVTLTGRGRLATEASDGPVPSVELDGRRVPTGDEITPEPLAPQPLAFAEDADPSTMTVELPAPVGPGEVVVVELDFTAQLPEVMARTGYKDDFYAVAQWFPKLGVLEEGGWEAHTFDYHSEFYADFGNYEVHLDVPEEMVVGATGIRVAEEPGEEGRKRLTYHAEMVHDFAWMADPDFVETFADYEGIRIRQLIQPEKLADADDHLAAQLAAFASYEARYGPYPWSTLTIIHPPKDARGAMGMEYPTLFTSEDRAPLPDWLRAHVLDERVSGIYTTVHEFGHQYFQGLFASNEQRQPWLDEGLNSMSNVLALSDRFGADGWIIKVFSHEIRLTQALRAQMRDPASLLPVDSSSLDFDPLVGGFGSTAYQKTSALFLTLRRLVGEAAFDAAFRRYAEVARFRHPTGELLEQVLIRELGPRRPLGRARSGATIELDVAEFLEQGLRTTRQVDFRLWQVGNRRRSGSAGWHRDAAGQLTGGEPVDLDVDVQDLPDEQVEGYVVVQRLGEFRLPVELAVDFADGSRETLLWDAESTTELFTWPGRRLVLAELDPDDKLLLESRQLDNVAYAEPNEHDDGLSRPVGDLAQALYLAIAGSLGP